MGDVWMGNEAGAVIVILLAVVVVAVLFLYVRRERL
jgi:hypothetical protein